MDVSSGCRTTINESSFSAVRRDSSFAIRKLLAFCGSLAAGIRNAGVETIEQVLHSINPQVFLPIHDYSQLFMQYAHQIRSR